jgi:hypothetical protein
MQNLLRNAQARAHKILKQTNTAASRSAFVAESLPPRPRKRPSSPPGASGAPMPARARRARHREQRELGDGGLPAVPLTESQLVEMVTQLESMPGPASLSDTTLLPPVDQRLAQSQQFLRDVSRDFTYVHWNIATCSPIRIFIFGRRYVPILKTFLRFFKKSEFRRRRTAGRPRDRA